MFLPLGSNLPFFRLPIVTLSWIAASVLIYVLLVQPDFKKVESVTVSQSEEVLHSTMSYQMAIKPGLNNEWWQYLTYQWIHVSWGHLLMNMWYLIIFGWILENYFGGLVFFLLTWGAGAFAVMTEIFVQKNPLIPIVGASGAVAFTLGAAVALFPSSKIKLWLFVIPMPGFPSSFFMPIRYLVYFWLFLQVSGLAMNEYLDPKPVAYATHLTGFAIGLLVGALTSLFSKKKTFLDVELSGKDLKSFYTALENYQKEKMEEANAALEQLSLKQPWLLKFQLQLFSLAVAYGQKDLAQKIYDRTLPSLLRHKRGSDLNRAIRSYVEAFGCPPLTSDQDRAKVAKVLEAPTPQERLVRIK